MPNISFSRINQYNTCPRAYRYAYIDGLDPVDDGYSTRSLDIGTLVHAGLETALVTSSIDEAIAVALDKISTLAANDSALSPNAVDTARDMLRTYIPMLGVGDKLRAYTVDDRPMVEYHFEEDITYNDLTLTVRGYIDAIVTTPQGTITLVDWKTRGYMSSPEAVKLDMQLYLYTYIARDTLGIPITRAAQVQLSSTSPATPKLTAKGGLSKRMGKTTKSLFDRGVRQLGLTPSDYYYSHMDKIVDVNHFIRIDDIDISPHVVSRMMQRLADSAQAMTQDTVYRPVHSANVCKYCAFKDVCLSDIGINP